ncbi:MAG: TlpA disulfide reductase family protein [Ferruginibacter sp.]
MKKQLLLVFVIFLTGVAKAQLLVGTPAPAISLPDTRDSVVQLASYQGKVVLVDFWASWCGPCRASNPAVLKMYKKYRDKGFVVFAVSIDVKKNAWLKAIKQDKLSYVLVNDNAGWDSPAAAAYKVDQIPTSFLLDKTGKIVAVDLEGKQLENKIRELL